MKRNILIFAVTLTILTFPLKKSVASVEFFSFVTEPQIVAPNELSEGITVQSQNSNHVPESTTETFDLTFNSTSLAGQFLGSTGKTATKTMSKNTTNRTFYYKDSSLGDFLLTVTAVGRDSKRNFVTTQHIIVGVQKKETTASKTVSSSKKTTNQKIETKNSKETVSASTTGELVVFEAPVHRSLISKILNFVKHLFVEE